MDVQETSTTQARKRLRAAHAVRNNYFVLYSKSNIESSVIIVGLGKLGKPILLLLCDLRLTNL